MDSVTATTFAVSACQPTLDPRTPSFQTCENVRKSGRGGGIRTPDPLLPKHYQWGNWGQRETAAPRFY
jgi:hypothetical protein